MSEPRTDQRYTDDAATIHRHRVYVDHSGTDHTHGACSDHDHWAGGNHEREVPREDSSPLNDPFNSAIPKQGE